MGNETAFFDVCTVVRDRFARDMRKASEDYEKRKKEIERDYKNEKLRAEHQQNKARFTAAKETAAEKAKKEILDEYEKASITERARVSCITVGADTMRALDALRGVPISAEEFAIIAESCANKGYWAGVKLRELARENGILSDAGLPATYTQKTMALHTARDRMLDFIERGDVESADFLITDKAFRMLESDFSNGFAGGYRKSAAKEAALLIDKAKSCGDPFNVAIFMKNAIETASDEVRAELVKAASADNSYWGTVREMGGLSLVLDKIEKENKISEKDALPLVADARLAKEVSRLSEAERKAALYGSSIVPDSTGHERKIDKAGLDFIKTEEGKKQVKMFEDAEKYAAAYVADKQAEAQTRADIESA